MTYIDVIVPVPLQGVFTYSVPDSMEDEIDIGCRVIVQFGKKKCYAAIVHQIHQNKNMNIETEIKEIISVLDKYPVVLPEQLKFWEWIASYYMCTLGEVMKAALPSAMKLESETHVLLEPEYESAEKFTPNEQKVFDILSDTKSLRISEIEKLAKVSNAIPYVKSLVDKGAAYISERVKTKFSAKTETAYKLAKNYTDKELSIILDDLKKAKKQQQLLFVFLELKQETGNPIEFFILKKQLLDEAGVTSAIAESLVEKGILESFRYEIGRLDNGNVETNDAKALNTDQTIAYQDICKAFDDKDIVLLHGVTSSGKTEIYIQLIKEAIERGEQVLYLLPEISL